MGKKIILSLFLLLVFILSSTSYAAENPFQGLTKEQVTNKYFAGRQLDPIEGIWIDDNLKPQIIIRTNLIDPNQKYNNEDYLMVEYSSSANVEISGIRKTEYPLCYRIGQWNRLLRIFSPTTLHYAIHGTYGGDYYLIRFYPSESKQ